MSSDLVVAQLSGRAFFEVHALNQRVFTELLPHSEDGFADFIFFFFLSTGLLRRRSFAETSEKIELSLRVLCFLFRLFRDDSRHVDSAHQEDRIDNTIKEIFGRFTDENRGRGRMVQINGSVRSLRDTPSIVIGFNFSVIAGADARIGQIFDIVADG